MAQDGHRQVSIARTAAGKYTVTKDTGGTISVGTGSDGEFTPVELLLAAIGACTAIDVDILTSRRAEPTEFTIEVGAGFEFYRSAKKSFRVEYRYHHISNDYTADQNPGIDNGLFQVTYAFGR